MGWALSCLKSGRNPVRDSPCPEGFGLFSPSASCVLGDTAGTCLRSHSWFCGRGGRTSTEGQQSCQELGDGAANKASYSSCPQHCTGRAMAQSSAWQHLVSSLFFLHGWKRPSERGSLVTSRAVCMKPGFPGHVLLFHLQPSPRQNLGTKHIF